RCLKYFNYPLNIMVSNNFVEEGEIAEGCVELKRDNLTNLYFRGEYLDLLENIREEILLNIPDYPMCQEDCLGLCSICGMDLNDKACHCKDKKEGPFRMLKKLINQEEN
ncbi:DUF177 domain-containing protein, partial [bacterium]|nr:DUF177 domain-containing protein [bacterium]